MINLPVDRRGIFNKIFGASQKKKKKEGKQMQKLSRTTEACIIKMDFYKDFHQVYCG